MRLPWAYANALAKQMYKADLIQWLDAEKLRGVVAALVKHQQKLQAKAKAEAGGGGFTSPPPAGGGIERGEPPGSISAK